MPGINGREDAPAAIYLGIVLVDFGHDQKDRRKGQRKCERGDKGIGSGIELLQVIQARRCLEQLWKEVLKLWKILLYCYIVIGAVLDRFDR